MTSKDLLEEILNNQKEMLSLQKKILKKEEEIDEKEQKVLDLEREELSQEQKILSKEDEEYDELKKLEEIEKEVLEKVSKDNALKKITYRDVTKGIIGAFFGIVGHFAFAKGASISQDFSIMRSTSLLITSFIIIIIFLYFTGFRSVKEKFVFKFLPVRALVIYFSALITVSFVLVLYGFIDFTTPLLEYYNTLAAISILAVIGAGTADLLGKVEE